MEMRRRRRVDETSQEPPALSEPLVVGPYAMIYHRADCDDIRSPPRYQIEIPKHWERLRSDGRWIIMRPTGPFLGRVSPRRCLEPCRSCLPELSERSRGRG